MCTIVRVRARGGGSRPVTCAGQRRFHNIKRKKCLITVFYNIKRKKSNRVQYCMAVRAGRAAAASYAQRAAAEAVSKF